MKKALAIILGMVILSQAAFAGGQKADTSTSGGLPFVEFDWYTVETPQPDDQMVNDAINEYIKPLINAKVTIHNLGAAEYRDRVPIMLASGQDMGIVAYGHIQLDYLINAQNGSFRSIDTLLDQYAPKTKALLSQKVWDGMKVDGHIYGIPAIKDNCYIIPLVYNDTMAKKLGIDMTKTPYTGNIYKIESWLNEVKAKRDQVYGKLEEPLVGDYLYLEMPFNFVIDSIFSDNFLAVMNIEGVMDVAGYDQYKIFDLYETKEYRDYCKALQRMTANNIRAYDYEGKNSWNYNGNMFAWMGWGYTYIPENLYGDIFTTKLLETDMAHIWTSTQNYYSSGHTISANAKNPERLMMFLELVNNDPKLATMLRFGIEGQHYIRNSAGKMVFEGSPRNSDASNRGYHYWYGQYGNLAIVEAPESYSGPNSIMMTKIEQFNKAATVPAYFGFSFNPNSVVNEIAACTNVVKEYSDTLRKGQAASEAEVDRLINEFTAKLKANGVDRIVAEAQKQADAWRAASR
ncbi:hypothetical protein FACS1894163_03260 [Spirochaetia bacterium]|nr:hypothetical protein FACS1894163_03260 [Spirochaetia bacterium]